MSKIYGAWIEPGDDAHGVEHEINDEDIVLVHIDHAETLFATAFIDIKNPRVGLLAPGRLRWFAIAIDLEDGSGAQRVFKGRIVGIPEQVTAERVRLHFDAKPQDYHAQKRALAATLNADPVFHDPVWLTEDELADPDAALKARTAHWHIDRVTLEVTTSDFTAGEDGTLVIGEDDHKREPFTFEPGDVPGRRVEVEAAVSWTQEAAGEVDITKAVNAAFEDGRVSSYTGEAVQRLWPTEGRNVGSGWTVLQSELTRDDGWAWPPGDFWALLITGGFVTYRKWVFDHTLVMGYEARRTFVETAKFAIDAAVQEIEPHADEPEDDDPLTITVRSRNVDEPVDGQPDTDNPEGLMPIRDKRRRQYFTTDRGKRSIDYLVALARRELLKSARSVLITCETSLAHGIDLSCRKNATIIDPRLPGGTATGKVVSYSLWVDGDTFTEGCSVTIACMVGEGGSVSSEPGTPSYVEAGVLEDGIQVMTGATHMPVSGEVTYDDFGHITPNDDGIDFFHVTADSVISSITLTGTVSEQEAVLSGFHSSKAAADAVLNEAHTELCIHFHSMTGGPFETDYPIVTSELPVAKGIDLAAGSSP